MFVATGDDVVPHGQVGFLPPRARHKQMGYFHVLSATASEDQ